MERRRGRVGKGDGEGEEEGEEEGRVRGGGTDEEWEAREEE